MLAYWLPATTHTLPVNATHRVGVGAFVMNDKREVLNLNTKALFQGFRISDSHGSVISSQHP
jgi:hypothetical protein